MTRQHGELTIEGNVLDDISIERGRQWNKFGEQNHDIYRWFAILLEEVGEVNQAVLDLEFGYDGKKTTPEDVRKELVQVAAVAVAIIECLDRHNGVLLPEQNAGTIKTFK